MSVFFKIPQFRRGLVKGTEAPTATARYQYQGAANTPQRSSGESPGPRVRLSHLQLFRALQALLFWVNDLLSGFPCKNKSNFFFWIRFARAFWVLNRAARRARTQAKKSKFGHLLSQMKLLGTWLWIHVTNIKYGILTSLVGGLNPSEKY